ncbi:hypothetical protein [Aestuariivivens sediminicola]|uniref:hypothetical protein n=1 Tax=Aestuariivivens sediminicola TaxID=2913560 RepID=UPI001F59FF8F|nr:hypothetical protein [Aestuariivivens sediminicola]
MKAVPLKEIKKELNMLSQPELQELCLRLSRFKKENKELLSYLLFESANEEGYIQSVKMYMDHEFDQINRASFFYIRKSMRKILRNVKKYIRYSQNKETEVELLLYFCTLLRDFKPSIHRSQQLINMYQRQIALVRKIVKSLHEDLQYDYNLKLDGLKPVNF